MDLKPGASETHNGLLERAGQLMRKHRSYAEPFDHAYEETFWIWFWGAWWEQQPAHTAGDVSQCALWKDPKDKAQCETWETKAAEWMKTREANRPR